MSGAIWVDPSAGVVATLVRGKQVVAVHKTGPPKVALAKIVRLCDRYGWKVRTLSSPATIYRDLAGSRVYRQAQRTDVTAKHYTEPTENDVAIPERAMLTHLGRLDLLA